jgi:alcohol dehydrogenase
MKASRLHELGTLKVEEIAEPTLRSGSVIVKILSTHIPPFTHQVISGELGYALPEFPFTPGTSAVGIIEVVADDVFDLEVGQKVFCDPYIYSTTIEAKPDAILLGWTGLAEKSSRVQSLWKDGTFAQQVLFPAQCLTPLGEAESIPIEKLACLSYLNIAAGGLIHAPLHFSQTLVVNGATGGLGSAAVLVGLAMGAAKVIAVGRSQDQLKILEQLDKRVVGIATIGDVEKDSQAIANAANGGADVVIDLLGGVSKPEPTLTCLNTLRRGGTAVFVGGVSVDIPLPYSKIMLEELTIKGSFMYPRHIPGELLRMISTGILNLDAIQVSRFSLDEITTAISKASTSKGLEYCVLIPN